MRRKKGCWLCESMFGVSVGIKDLFQLKVVSWYGYNEVDELVFILI